MRIKLKKIHLKKFFHIKIRKRDIIVSTIFVIILFTLYFLHFVNKKVTPILMNYAEAKVTNLATLMITQAVNDKVFEQMSPDDLFITQKDDTGNITSIDFNSVTVNSLLNMVTNYVQDYLQKVENGNIDNLGVSDSIFSDYDINKLRNGIVYEIPSGVIFKNSLLSNLGPKVPVKLNLVGDVISDIDTDVSNYGINNALIKVTLKVQVNMQVLLPFSKKNIKAETNVPIAMKLVQGNVPNMYYDLAGLKK